MHIIKRSDTTLKDRLIVRAVAIFLALIVISTIIIILTHLNPLAVFSTMAKGTFSSFSRFMVAMRDTSFLWLIGIGLVPAFKMKFWNTGAEGQVLVGGIVSAAWMITMNGKLSPIVFFLGMFTTSFIAGAIWGLIPAYFYSKYRTNETLFTLMMNYIAMQIAHFMVDVWDKKQSHSVGIINMTTQDGWFKPLFGQQYGFNILLTLLFAAGMFFYLYYSKHGYEITVVGESEKTARYAGIDVNKVILRTMMISGGICGIAGYMQVAGISHTIASTSAGGNGFTAIIVTWIAQFNPFMMGLISFMLTFLDKGAIQISSRFNLNDYASDMMIGILLFFIIGSEFFINYRIVFKKKGEE
ncbi:MAG: ABC transporter permease [Erysipelotrichaceae bacterium]|nr:ABC transporter permease [Erysipelotrichaceae bacterium]